MDRYKGRPHKINSSHSGTQFSDTHKGHGGTLLFCDFYELLSNLISS